MRMVPYMPLSMTMTTIGEIVLDGGGELLPVHQEVAVAGEARRRSRSGYSRLAAIAAGTPKPIEPEVGPSCCSKRRKRRKRPGQMAKLPAPLVKIASGDALGAART